MFFGADNAALLWKIRPHFFFNCNVALLGGGEWVFRSLHHSDSGIIYFFLQVDLAKLLRPARTRIVGNFFVFL